MSKFNVGDATELRISIPAQDGYLEKELLKIVEVVRVDAARGTCIIREKNSIILSEVAEDRLTPVIIEESGQKP